MPRKKSSKGVSVATVGDYEERPDAQAEVVEETKQPDQIADYHETHPTLNTSGPEHDPQVQRDLLAGVGEPVDEPVD